MILHIAKGFFNFKNTLDKHCLNRTTHSTYDIKSWYTNIGHNIFYKAVKYWIEKLQMIYRYCDFFINNLSLKACRLF